MGRPPTTFQEAEQVRTDLLSKHPEGLVLTLEGLEAILVQGRQKSAFMATRIVKTGELAGFWRRRRNPQARNGGKWTVEVFPAPMPPSVGQGNLG